MTLREHTGISPLASEKGAVFAEPWQAQVLAMADALVRAGCFSPAEWSDALGSELKRAEAAGAPDTTETYYEAALKALEGLAGTHAGISGAEMSDRREAWERAYRRTPHGQPVRLGAGGTEGRDRT
ncbi:MAG: nitrile hydratase accessory protein [Paracoccaceae bacterium]